MQQRQQNQAAVPTSPSLHICAHWASASDGACTATFFHESTVKLYHRSETEQSKAVAAQVHTPPTRMPNRQVLHDAPFSEHIAVT